MWPSLETAVWLYDIANVLLIIALIAGVIATALVVWAGNVKEDHLKRDVASAYERAAQANLMAEQERHERIRLEATIAPRELSFPKMHEIIAALKPFSGLSVQLYLRGAGDDLEVVHIASDIEYCLVTAGIRVELAPPVSMAIIGRAVDGIVVSGTNDAFVNASVTAFRDIGGLKIIGVGGGISPSFGHHKPNTAAVFDIGPKTLPRKAP